MSTTTLVDNVRLWFGALFGQHNEGPDSDPDVKEQVERMFDFCFDIDLDPNTNGQIDTTKRHVHYARKAFEIVEVKYVPDAAWDEVANATNSQLISLYKGNGAAAAATLAALLNTHAQTANWVAGTPQTFTLSATAANIQVAAGNTLAADTVNVGTSETAIPKGSMTVYGRWTT